MSVIARRGGTLYRVRDDDAGVAFPEDLFANFFYYSDNRITTNLNRAIDNPLSLNISRLVDGVVHLRVRPPTTPVVLDDQPVHE